MRTSFLLLLVTVNMAVSFAAVDPSLTNTGKRELNSSISTAAHSPKLNDVILKSLQSIIAQESKNTAIRSAQNSSSQTTPKPIPIKPAEPKIESQQSQHLDAIMDKLRERVAKTCAYGYNPRLLDICPDLVRNREPDFLKDLRNTTLNHIRDSIVNASVVAELQAKCFAGEWCLKESVFDFNAQAHTFSMKLARSFNSKVYCAFGDCFSEVAAYINDCVHDEISRSVLNIAPKLCTFNSNLDNEFCPEQTMRLIHVAVAAFSPPRNSKNTSAKPKTNVSC
jgi:hypothetical protein